MAINQPNRQPPSGVRPAERSAEPALAAASPLVAVLVLVGAIVAFVALGAWTGLAVALALMVLGVAVLARYVGRLARTGPAPQRSRRNPGKTSS